jgi:recombination protein U
LIQKIDVPIRVTNTGFVAALSTVDFVGVYKYTMIPLVGKAIAFDAKECMSTTSFPLSNIKQHQLIYLTIFSELGGSGFFFIHFKKIKPNHAYITPPSLVNSYWNTDKRKSIPLTDFKDEWLVPIDDYLPHFINTII